VPSHIGRRHVENLDRVTIETNELNKSRSFYYDAAGNLSRRKDRNGRMIQFEHDGLDRRTAEKWYTAAPVPSLAIATTVEGGPINEVQRVGFSDPISSISGGTFTLSFGGQTTSAIAYNASAATVQSALEGLSSIGSGNVSVVKLHATTSKHEWQITYTGSLGGTNVSQMTINAASVTTMMGPPTEIEATDTTGGNGNEQQTVTLTSASGGVFRLAFEGETSQPIAYNASSSTVETALEELNIVDNVTVSGSAGGPWTVTFVGDHSGLNVSQMTGDAATLTNGTLVRTISFEYDAANQLTSASDPDSAYAYTYDNLGRVLTVDNDDTPGAPHVTLTNTYDANSNRTSLSAEIDSTDDFQNTYSYDNLNRLLSVGQVQPASGNSVAEKRVDFTYNSLGQFTSIARYNDLDGGSSHEIATSNFSYDTLHRLTGLSHQQDSTNLFTPYSYTYDDLSRITQFVSADSTSNYTYDATSQLTATDHSYQTDESYSYDDNGNRTMSGYDTGDNNQLLSDGTYDYTYDDEGNRLTRTHISSGDVTEYAWDHRNRLVSVTDYDDSETILQLVAYTYDLFNRRLSRALDTTDPFELDDASTERFIYDDAGHTPDPFNPDTSHSNVILDFLDPDGEEETESLALAKRYLHGAAVDQLLAQEDVTESISSADRVLWPLSDHLGTVRDLVQNDGTLGEHYEYDSFGNVASGDTSITRYLFTSRELDEATDLQYARARWYDPAAGRWSSEDPIGFRANDRNLYRYSGNSPMMSTDPSGLEERTWAAWWKSWQGWLWGTGVPATTTAATYAVPGSELTSAVEAAPEMAKTAVLMATKKKMLDDLKLPVNMQDKNNRAYQKHVETAEKMERVFAPRDVETHEEGRQTPSIGIRK